MNEGTIVLLPVHRAEFMLNIHVYGDPATKLRQEIVLVQLVDGSYAR